MAGNPAWKDVKEVKRLLDTALLHDRDDAGKPSVWRDRNGSGVSVMALKGVLNSLLDFYPNMFPSIDTIADRCGMKTRTVKRAIEVLQAKDLLAVEHTRSTRGQTNSRYTILYSKLRYLAQDERLQLFQQPGATMTDPSAIRAKPGATMTDPGATDGTLRPNQQEINTTSKRPVGADLFSSEEEAQQVLARDDRQRAVVGRPVRDQARIMIYIGIWVERGFLSENDFEECLRTVEKNNPMSRFGYYKTSITNRLSNNGHSFDELMKKTTRELSLSTVRR